MLSVFNFCGGIPVVCGMEVFEVIILIDGLLFIKPLYIARKGNIFKVKNIIFQIREAVIVVIEGIEMWCRLNALTHEMIIGHGVQGR